MDVSIDLGNVWDMLSAIGTVGAVVLSMWVIRRENKSEFMILCDSENKQKKIGNGTTVISTDRIIKVKAYNSGRNTVGISFIGFSVGIKKKSFLNRIMSRETYEKKQRLLH